ncbi:hypothetical protein F5Y14DRAFT_456981 [Nemania sp. NC0429]|nr:hypothetical protein F5Y14DRAFT_456981 [Nemania sp. NC0429]
MATYPHARSVRMGRRLFSKEVEIFSPGVSWAVCFYKDQDPMVPEFQPPEAGPLDSQTFALFVPYSQLSSFTEQVQVTLTSWVPRLKDPAAHCRLKLIKCDDSGVAHQLSHTLFAYCTQSFFYYDHFKFCGALPAPGVLLESGSYFIECEFYNSHWETQPPDAKYTTGTD